MASAASNRTLTVVTGLALTLASTSGQAQVSQERGRLHVVWDADGGAMSSWEYYLVDAEGAATRLRIDATSLGNDLLLSDRRMVEVRTAGRTSERIPTASLLDARVVDAGMFANLTSGARNPYNFITLLCQFADDAIEPLTIGEVERAHGSEYPGAQNFFAELSWDDGIMHGSRVAGWYRLPRPRSAYVTSYGTDFGALAQDCTAAADGDVYFPDFHGINLQLSGGLSTRGTPPYDVLSFGGSWTLTLDGVSRSWGMTWLSEIHARNYVVLTHEMGHALGWPHSSGDYGNEYDSSWDVMSRGYLRWEQPHGWMGNHTIAHHKDLAGWIAAERQWTPAAGATESALIARTALPSADGYLIARVPTGTSTYYTIEARRLAGQDRPLPAEAVVLHHVAFNRARVVDIDNNGDPNDAAAQWIPGEVFHDSIRGVTVSVDSASAFGFHVSVTRGWRLDLVVTGSGSIEGASIAGSGPIDCESECSAIAHQRGARAVLSPAAAEGWRFVEWRGACSGSGACVTAMNGNRRVEAVFAAGAVVVRADDAVPAIMGADYLLTLTVDGATGTAAWRLTDGTLPAGLTLDESAGAISGVPGVAGTFDVSVSVRIGATDLVAPVTIRVDKPVLGLQQVIDQVFGGTSLTTNEVRFLDLLGNGNGLLDIGDVRRWLIDAEHLSDAERSSAAVLLRAGGSLR